MKQKNLEAITQALEKFLDSSIKYDGKPTKEYNFTSRDVFFSDGKEVYFAVNAPKEFYTKGDMNLFQIMDKNVENWRSSNTTFIEYLELGSIAERTKKVEKDTEVYKNIQDKFIKSNSNLIVEPEQKHMEEPEDNDEWIRKVLGL